LNRLSSDLGSSMAYIKGAGCSASVFGTKKICMERNRPDVSTKEKRLV
jgi:hypothetical protein